MSFRKYQVFKFDGYWILKYPGSHNVVHESWAAAFSQAFVFAKAIRERALGY